MATPTEVSRTWTRRLAILVPYLWLAVFFLVPVLIVLKISFSHTALAAPPYTPVFDLGAGLAGLRDYLAALSFETYGLIASDPLYLLSYLKSLEIALIST